MCVKQRALMNILWQKKKSLTNIHKQLQNVCVSVLLVKALTLVLHKLQVPWKPKQRSVIHSHLFIQNDQWLTDRESLQLRGVGRTVLLFQRFCSMQPNRASPICVARVAFRFPVLFLGWWTLLAYYAWPETSSVKVTREKREKSTAQPVRAAGRSIEGNGRGEAVTSRRYGTRNRITSQA